MATASREMSGAWRALPDLDPVAGVVEADHRVERLHLRVIAEIALELGLVDLGRARERRLGVAAACTVCAWRVRIVMDLARSPCQRLSEVEAGGLALLQVTLSALLAASARSKRSATTAMPLRKLHGGDHARHLLDLGVVPALRRAIVHRRVERGGVDHAGHAHVDAVCGRAVDLRAGCRGAARPCRSGASPSSA